MEAKGGNTTLLLSLIHNSLPMSVVEKCIRCGNNSTFACDKCLVSGDRVPC